MHAQIMPNEKLAQSLVESVMTMIKMTTGTMTHPPHHHQSVLMQIHQRPETL